MNKSSLLKSGFWATYGTIATRMLALLSNLILARLLLPSEFGVISVVYIFWAFANLFVTNTAGSYLVYKGLEDKRYVNTAYTISLGIGLILALGFVAIGPLAADFFKVPSLVWILMVLAFNLLLSSAQGVYIGVLRQRMQHREIANSTTISSLVRVVCTIGSAFLGFSYWSFVIGDTAFWLTVCILMHRQSKLNFRLQIDPEARAEVLSYCLGATGSGIGLYINYNCDNFVVGRFLGSTSLGYYNFAYQLTMALTTILNQVMAQVGMSVFAQLEDDRQQENVLVNVVEQLAFLCAPVYALFFLIVDQNLISLVFGEKWVPACAVIPWLLLLAYFRLINTSLSCMLSAKGRPGVNARVNLHIAPLAALGFVIGVQQAGIVGVSIAVAIILGILWTIYWWWTGCRELGWSLMKFLIPCFKSVLIALLAIFISLSIPKILQPLLFIGIYLLCFRFMAAKQFFECKVLISRFIKKLVKVRRKI
ncbi:MAG: lipopolysaccharide biosynthesis protein [Cyanobacteriota bacterium]